MKQTEIHMVRVEETHLTKRQFEVLRMKIEGKSLSEIAKTLGTSRSNVSRLSKIAKLNVERAKNTMKLMATIRWPVKVVARAGSNVYEVSEMIFREADKKGISISQNYSGLVSLITEALGRKNIRRRNSTKNFTVLLSEEGKVEVFVGSSKS